MSKSENKTPKTARKKGRAKKEKPATPTAETEAPVVPSPLEQLRDEFLSLNGGCPNTALLAACEQLCHYAEEIELLERSSISGFLRGLDHKKLRDSRQS